MVKAGLYLSKIENSPRLGHDLVLDPIELAITQTGQSAGGSESHSFPKLTFGFENISISLHVFCMYKQVADTV